jgi:hypothetical protein
MSGPLRKLSQLTRAGVQIAIGALHENLVFIFGYAAGNEIPRAHSLLHLTKEDAVAIRPNDHEIPKLALA